MSLDYALRRYETWRLDEAGFSPLTWAGEKSGLLAFVDAMGGRGRHYPATLTHEDAAAWWAFQSTLQESTRATRLHQVRSFLGYCSKRGWLQGDPTALLRAPRPPAAWRERLDVEELLSLLDAADTHSPRDRVLLALALNLGLRGGEISKLTIRDVDLDGGWLRVQISKTRDEDDAMPISLDLSRELTRWLGVYAVAVPGLTPASYLVPSVYASDPRGIIYRHEKPYTEPYRTVQRALSAIGWESTKQEGVHTVRRSVARIYFDMVEADEGSSFDSALLATMTLLHHKRPETTLHYIGRDRAVLARDRMLRGKAFLSRLATDAGTPTLRIAQ